MLHVPFRRQYNIFKSMTTVNDLPPKFELIILYKQDK